jgi:ribonuclease R
MKLLLIQLTLGLHQKDIDQKDEELINSWSEKGYLKLDNKKYRLSSKYRAGVLGVVQKGSAYLNVLGVDVKDLFISEDYIGDAKAGDLIIAQRLLGGRGRPTAKIVEIVGRSVSYSVAFVKKNEGRLGLYDIRSEHPAGVEISDEELNSYSEGDCFQIDNQTTSIIQKLGNLSDPLVDEKIVLSLYNKHDDFEPDVLQQARDYDKNVDASLYPDRRDIRDMDFCTIDPVTAKDFDDAICYDGKNSILYVAIADVSSYVKPFGAIDAEAIYRSFSIYLPHRSIPMLPRELSETLCSLQAHVDRLAYVFEIHLNKESLEVTKTELYEAIIHSKRRFNYEEIDHFFEGKLKAQNEDEKRIFNALTKLRVVTDRLKFQRLKVGYDFRNEELDMFLNDKGLITDTIVAPETPSHALIEDCMLLANKAAATKYTHGVFRIHESPSQTKLQLLYQELAGIGMMIEPQGSIKEIITNIQHQARERDLESEVDTLIIRSQMQAKYAPFNAGHFGLGFEEYTHFTSPIRRYSDLIVHRLLKALAANDDEESSYVLRNIDALTITISEKEREASDIEIKFMARKFARWANENIGKIFHARIIATEPEYRAEIHAHDDDDNAISGTQLNIKSVIPIQLFNDVMIKIETVNLATAKIHATVTEKLVQEHYE